MGLRHERSQVHHHQSGPHPAYGYVDATPMRAEGGAVERVLVILQDLAPFEALARSRAEFLSTVSHELRAPLAAIKGSATTALEGARDPDRSELRQFLRIVGEQADRMDGLIGDLLDAGRIGAGVMPVDPEARELAGLVERARTAFAAAGDRHAVVVDLPTGLLRVMADPRRVVQVLDNRLGNAARHPPDASPIRVAAEPDGAHVAVSVADDGEGIAPERLAHLFRRHAGIDGGGGSGLGLVICRGLVEAHGGRIRAESPGRAAARRSPSPCRRRRRRIAPPPTPRPRPRPGGAGPPCWWCTTTRTRCARCATRWRRPATPRRPPPGRARWPAWSRPRTPRSRCST